MTIESVLYARLTGFAGLAALIGDRVYSVPAPQGVVIPFITYEQISAIREEAFGSWIDVVVTRMQLDVMTSTASSRGLIRRQVASAFRSWHDYESSPVLFGAHLETDQGVFDDETALYRAIMDVILYHREE